MVLQEERIPNALRCGGARDVQKTRDLCSLPYDFSCIGNISSLHAMAQAAMRIQTAAEFFNGAAFSTPAFRSLQRQLREA
eukprot:1286596-Amphidinium_carterae.1